MGYTTTWRVLTLDIASSRSTPTCHVNEGLGPIPLCCPFLIVTDDPLCSVCITVRDLDEEPATRRRGLPKIEIDNTAIQRRGPPGAK